MRQDRMLVLVVDDLLEIRRMEGDWLKRAGFEAVEAESVVAAAQAVHEIPTLRVVLTDLQIVGGTARDLHRQVGGLIRDRGGLFTLLTGSSFDEPRLAPYGEYFAEHNVPVFQKPVLWRDELIPFLDAFRNRCGG